jgi:hypothetical protein
MFQIAILPFHRLLIPKKIFLYLSLCISFLSCRTPRFIYSPSLPNNPYFREKGESKLAVSYATGADDNELTNEYNEGLDVRAAIAVSNKWAITSDYFLRNEKDVFTNYDRTYFDSSLIRYNRKIFSGGAGYFMPVTRDRKIMLSLYGGFGLGKFSFKDQGFDNNGLYYNRYYNQHINKFHVQPSLNFFTEYFRTGFIGKISWVHYGKTTTDYTTAELIYLNLDRLPGSSLTFIETTWNIQVTAPGIEWLYIDAGFTFSSEPFDNTINLEARNFCASIGLNIDFSKLKRKKTADD